MSDRKPEHLRPAWDGIVGWLLVLAGLVAVSAAAQHLPVNGADLVALLVTVAGLALVARRMGGPGE